MNTDTMSRKGIGGPKTPEGKQRSSLNALKHGLNAMAPHACQSVAEQYAVEVADIHSRMRAYYRPDDVMEEELVKRIALCLARLERSAMSEHRMIEKRGDLCAPGASLRSLVRYERTVDIHLHRAIAALERKRSAASAKK